MAPIMDDHPMVDHRPGHGVEESWCGPLFIVGMPRSGTKLLRALLCQHGSIRVLAAETEFLPLMASWVDSHGPPVSEQAFAALYEAMRNAPYFSYRQRYEPAFDWRRWRDRCEGRYDVGGLFEGFSRYELALGRRATAGGPIWADKSPAYIRHIPLLLHHFPQARIIHIVRDVRDQCASSRRAWGKDVRRGAVRWAHDVLDAHRHCTAHRQRCIEVRFEDLLRDPDGQMQQICDFLSVEYSCTMAELQQPVERRGNAAGRNGIVRDNFHTYRQHLAPREIEAIESLAWEAMSVLGYVPELAQQSRRLSTSHKHWLRVKDAIRLVQGDAHRKGWMGALRFHVDHLRMLMKR